jgi:hypothetical protein
MAVIGVGGCVGVEVGRGAGGGEAVNGIGFDVGSSVGALVVGALVGTSVGALVVGALVGTSVFVASWSIEARATEMKFICSSDDSDFMTACSSFGMVAITSLTV